MDSLVKNNMRVEITSCISKGNVIQYTAVRLPLLNEYAHCAIRANDENGIHMILRCPSVCVQNKFLFAIALKLGGVLLFHDNFKKISSSSMIVLLDRLTMDDLNNTYNEIKDRSASKIYFDVLLTIKSEQLTPHQRLLRDIASPELFDFTFEVGDKRFQAHKFILSARSPVFARMLSNGRYKETQQSVMQVTDTSETAFKLFLNFIYKADVPSLSVYGAIELIKLAEKYDFGDLKSICETAVINKLTQSDSFYEIYLFAHRYNCSQALITKAFQFVQKKYFIGKSLPANLCNNPDEVQQLVAKMKEFDDTLQKVHEDLFNPPKKSKGN